MKQIFKRLIAYFIDIIIVTALVSLLISNDKTNFQYNNYQKHYKEYNKTALKYEKVLKRQVKLETKKASKKITSKEYKIENKRLNKDKKKYFNSLKTLQYSVTRNLIIYYLVYIAFLLGYFGIFQASFNGQTLGKRLMKIRVVNIDGETTSILRMLIRAFFLYKIWVFIAYIVLVYTVSKNNFYLPYQIFTNVGNYYQLLILLMIVISKSNRGLHDYIVKTKVIDINNNELEAEIVKEKGDK